LYLYGVNGYELEISVKNQKSVYSPTIANYITSNNTKYQYYQLAIMKRKIVTLCKLLPFALSLLMGAFTSTAQQIPCPPNIDFEFGDFTFWTGQTGGSQTGSAATGAVFINPVNVLPAMVPTRFQVTSGTGTDMYGGFPVVCPGGGAHSLKLGNNVTGAQAERVRYKVQVPAGINNYAFNFKYAVVFEDPGHAANQQPRFEVTAFDSATGLTIPCVTQSYVAAASIPGFFTSPLGFNVRYKPWSAAVLSVGNTAGQTIYLEISTYDCTLGGHFGYGYFDVIDCGQFNTAIASCDLDGVGIVLSGPPGFMTYQWYDQTFTTQVAVGQTTTFIPTSTTPQYYNLVLTPFPTVSTCKDTIQTKMIANVDVQALPDTSCMTPGIPIQLDANTFGGIPPLTYQWTEYNTPGNTLSCYTCPQPVANPVGSSFYTIKVTDSNGCYRTDTLQVYYSVFVPNAGPDMTTCVSTPITLNGSVTPASSAFQYKWTPSTDLNFDTLLMPTMTPTTAGTFTYVLAVDSIACTKTDTMVVEVLPDNIFIADTTICKGEVVRVNALGDPRFTYSWSPTIGLSNPAIVDPIITTDTSRTYIVTASYPGCPPIVKTYNVKVEPLPSVSIGGNIEKCQWDDKFITSTVTPNWYSQYSYQWIADPAGGLSSNNTPNVTFTGQNDASLKLIVRTPVGCSDSDEVEITVHAGNFASITPGYLDICPNTSVPIKITGGKYYSWIPPTYLDDSTAANVVSNPITDINYTVYVTDTFGCRDTLTTSLVVHPAAALDAGANTTIYPGDTVQMQPAGNCLYYQWFPPQGLSATNIMNPLASPSVNTRYFVTGTTEYGCTVQDSVDITVNTETVLTMPNAFTPGTYGNNTTLKLIRKGTATLKSLKIFDRWGKLVFQTTNIDEGWDGTYKGTPQPMGVYVYIVDAVSNSGRAFTKQGNITLIR